MPRALRAGDGTVIVGGVAVIEVDVLIIGGGPSGISTALHLHAANPRVKQVVLEAKAYPREKICAGGIGARAFRKLERIGITGISCPMVNLNAIALRVGNDTIVMREPDLGVVVRRVEFDHAFAKIAMERGIEVREQTPVASITIADDHVRVETEGGDIYRAKAIVGADGVAGITRKAAGFAPHKLRAQVVELDTEAAPSDQPRDTIVFDFTMRDLHGYAWDFPTVVNNQPLVCRGAYLIHNLAHDSAKARIGQYLEARGLDPTKYKLKQFAERGFEPGHDIARPRVLLVGEAAGIDIATGEGIAQAIEYGYVAGPYLAKSFERDDYGFGGWLPHLEHRHVGWQLRVRHFCYEVFYGERRDMIERMMPRMATLMSLGVQDFAGKPLSRWAMLRGSAQFLRAFAREKMRDPDRVS